MFVLVINSAGSRTDLDQVNVFFMIPFFSLTTIFYYLEFSLCYSMNNRNQ